MPSSTTPSSSSSSLSTSSPSTSSPSSGPRSGLVQVTVAAVLWGTTGVVVQLVRETTDLGAVAIGFHRLAVAAVVLLLLSAARLGALLVALRSAPWQVVLVGAGLGAYQALYVVAVTTAGVGVATVVSLGLAPVLTAAWEAARARRRPGTASVVTLLAAVAGLVLVTVSTTHATASAPRPLLGLLAATGSGLGYAATTLLSRHVAQRVAARDLTTLSTAVGALALAPVAVLEGAGLPADPQALVLLAYLGVVTTAVAYGLFYAGLRSTSGSAAAVLTLLEPLTAALLAVVLLAEPLPLPTVAGGGLLLGAVAGLYLAPAPSPAPSWTPSSTPSAAPAPGAGVNGVAVPHRARGRRGRR